MRAPALAVLLLLAALPLASAEGACGALPASSATRGGFLWEGRVHVVAGDALVALDPLTCAAEKVAALPVDDLDKVAWDGRVAWLLGGSHTELVGGDAVVQVPDALVVRYDPATGALETRKARLPAPRGFSAFVADGALHVLGGSGANLTDRVWRYDAEADAFRLLDVRLPEPRALAGVGVLDGVAYVFGGIGEERYFADVVRLDLRNGTATRLDTRFPGAGGMWNVAVLAREDSLLLVGGGRPLGDVRTIHRFTPDEGIQAVAATLPEARQGAAAVDVHGSLLVAGGTRYGSAQKDVFLVPLEGAATPALPPEAALACAVEGDAVVCDASATKPGSAPIDRYEWWWDDGPIEITTEPRVRHAYRWNGNYSIQVTVMDAADQRSSAGAFVAMEGSRDPGARGFEVEVRDRLAIASVARFDHGMPARAHWDWGDGTPEGYGEQASHEYAAPGTYVVTLRLMDMRFAWSNWTETVTVGRPVAAPPTPSPTPAPIVSSTPPVKETPAAWMPLVLAALASAAWARRRT